MTTPIEMTREVVAGLTPQHRIVVRNAMAPEGVESEVALWADPDDGTLRLATGGVLRWPGGAFQSGWAVTAIIDPPTPTLTTDEAERARAAGWTPPEEKPKPLPTTVGSVVEHDGQPWLLRNVIGGGVGWSTGGGSVDGTVLRGARILYDAGTGQAVAR